MDILKDLEDAKARRRDIVNEINQLVERRQALLQEALRVDGEVRALERVAKESKTK